MVKRSLCYGIKHGFGQDLLFYAPTALTTQHEYS